MIKKVLFVSHDANRAGSQLLLLQLLKHLKVQHVPIHLLLANGGSLEEEFREVCEITYFPQLHHGAPKSFLQKAAGLLKGPRSAEKELGGFQKELENLNIGLVFVNSIANAELYHTSLQFLHQIPMVLFAHELAMSAGIYAPEDHLSFLVNKSQHLIAVSNAVTKYYTGKFNYPEDRVSTFTLIDHEFVDDKIANADYHLLHKEFNIPEDAIIIGGCGNAEWRKGNDIFNWIAYDTLRKSSPLPVYFVWVGVGEQHEIHDLILADIQRMGLGDKIILIPPVPNAMDYISRFDIFLLSSREDPYPLVVTEAALNETPIVCFEKAGGAPELVEKDAGFVVPFMSVSAAADAIMELIVDPSLRNSMGRNAREKVLERHNTPNSIEKVKAIIQQYVALPVSEKSGQ